MTQPLLSGFMIVKNVVEQGYPFIEAIRSALPICDEFLVSDGYSTDDTWPALEVLRGRWPDRVKLFRDPWPGNQNRGGALARMTNVVRFRCAGRYIFNLQANEILHEVSAGEIVSLIEQLPDVVLFRLPFHNLLGDRLLWMTDHRRRLAVNRRDIESLADAYDLGPNPSVACRLRRFLKRESAAARRVALSQPVYRYRALFPTDYIRRLAAASEQPHLWRQELGFARTVHADMNPERDDPAEFWRRMRVFFDQAMFENLPSGVEVPDHIPRCCAGEIADAPAIVKPLFGQWRYPMADSLNRVRS